LQHPFCIEFEKNQTKKTVRQIQSLDTDNLGLISVTLSA